MQGIGSRHPAPNLMEETNRGIFHVKESLIHGSEGNGVRRKGQTQRIVWTEKGL
jgi:hypothetical protein